MLASIWSSLGFKDDEKPPPVTINAIRFPADGSPAHIVSLTTTSDGVKGNVDSFLFHIPDMRPYWKVARAWQYRDLQRIEIEGQRYPSCNGLYHAFFSFALDDLPQNTSVPAFVGSHNYWGDVFVVKMAPGEWGEHGWALYEDVVPEFLELPIMKSSWRGF